MNKQYRDRVRVSFGVLGPVAAWDPAGEPLALRGPRHRAVLARLIAANGRVVPLGDLVTDLWVAPPAGAVASVRTFVAALRRAIEPAKPPRAAASILVTSGPGYALHAATDDVDAWRFEAVLRAPAGVAVLAEALSWWRGPAYADFPDDPWARGARARLAELRLQAVEALASARLDAGRPEEAIPDLDAHVTEHPWRENAWRLLALALYRTGRQADALAVVRRARVQLAERLGLDPSPALAALESDILRQAASLHPADSVLGASVPAGPGPDGSAAQVWANAAADYNRIVGGGARARLDSTVGLLRSLAVTGGGGLVAARRHRVAAITAAEELGDPELTARVIGAYDVPAIWSRSDDPAQAAQVVAAASRALAAAGPAAAMGSASAAGSASAMGSASAAGPASASGLAARARLLATIAVETRGLRPGRLEEAREAVRLAREQDDPALLAFALNGLFMQTTYRAGLARERDAIGVELVDLAGRHGLVTSEVLGHLIRMQALGALDDFGHAEAHAEAADALAARHELPLVGVFTEWFRALRLSLTDPSAAEPAYRRAAARLDGAGMPGLENGLLDLAVLTVRLRRGLPATDGDYGPYEPWVRPLVLLGKGRPAEARQALRSTMDPPPDLLTEAMWSLLARAADALGDEEASARARQALLPAAGELAGAGSGLLTLGTIPPPD
ncbi:AfsR/SARP family transcriptional regulator [Actinoplanes sp. CA-142083]|uniref:AfsR/SARP family transcriptional regulator n=1 Tax=Actinoplanes sp. CA-142083 TaxID=3239903 RepID=UPI003D8FFF70